MAHEIVAEGPPDDRDVVIAVDLGAGRTAFSWKLFGKEEQVVEVEVPHGATEPKVPTVVYIERNENGSATVRDFGSTAEESYRQDSQDEPRDSLYLFQDFKMHLHRRFHCDLDIESADGRCLPLSVVLQACLEHIKEQAIERVKSKGVLRSGGAFDVTWALTVPALWSDFARHVMRRAAHAAGLIQRVQSRRLVLALEPECAAIAFMEDTNRPQDLEIGDQLMIVDCGAGTLDITTHKIKRLHPLELEEVIAPQGDALGARRIDENFLTFLKEFLGAQHFENLKDECTTLLALMKVWEDKKRRFQFDQKKKRNVSLSFGDLLATLSLTDQFEKLISEWNGRHSPHKLKAQKTYLQLPFDLMCSFFEGPVQDVVNKVDAVVTDNWDKLEGLKHIILAGGFSRCPLFKERMEARFPMTVSGNDPDLLIVKGAAMYGGSPRPIVKSRIAKFTFGIKAMTRYDETDQQHKMHEASKVRAHDGSSQLPIFCVYAQKGTVLEQDSVTERRIYSPANEHQTVGELAVLCTKSDDVFLAESDDVQTLGTTMIPLNMSVPFHEGRIVGVEFAFGDTEVKCHAYDGSGNPLGELDIAFSQLVEERFSS